MYFFKHFWFLLNDFFYKPLRHWYGNFFAAYVDLSFFAIIKIDFWVYLVHMV